jgi:hypothetical protein
MLLPLIVFHHINVRKYMKRFKFAVNFSIFCLFDYLPGPKNILLIPALFCYRRTEHSRAGDIICRYGAANDVVRPSANSPTIKKILPV